MVSDSGPRKLVWVWKLRVYSCYCLVRMIGAVVMTMAVEVTTGMTERQLQSQ